MNHKGITMRTLSIAASRRQKGSALMIAIVLLLLAGLMSILAMNIGMFEQRSSGNDLRAKVVKQVAEASLTQGFEYLFRANPAMIEDAANWVACSAGDKTFPCGAVPAASRATMFRLKADVGGYVDTDANKLSSDLTQYMLKTDANRTVGSFDVASGVAPVLCFVAEPISGTAITCTKDKALASERRVVTFVSIAQIRGDSGRTTLSQTVARSSILAPHGAVPTIIASGGATPPGNGTIIPMGAASFADGSSDSNDIAIWTLGDAQLTGSSRQMCTYSDFVSNEAEAGWEANRDCSGQNCVCSSESDIDESNYEKKFVYDVEPSCADAAFGVDEIRCTKKTEFPCDLFEYIFAVKAWNDSDGDGFCETRIPRSDVELPGKVGKFSLYPDEAFLYANAKQIFAAAGNLKVRSEQMGPKLDENSSGLIWCQAAGGAGCLKDAGTQVGSVAHPVLLIVDSDMATNILLQGKIIGLVFFRQVDGTLVPGSTSVGAAVGINAGAEVYGSIVIQGFIKPGAGHSDLVGDRQIMQNLRNDPLLTQFDTLRGGWTDRPSY